MSYYDYITGLGVCKLGDSIYLVCGGEEQSPAFPSGRLGFSIHPEIPTLVEPVFQPKQKEWMVLEDKIIPSYPLDQNFVENVAKTIQTSHWGLICDFERPPTPLFGNFIRDISILLQRKNLGLMVPATYATATAYGLIMAQTTITDGSFIQQCKRLQNRWGKRLVLEIAPIAFNCTLGQNPLYETLTATKRKSLQSMGGTTYFSKELGCNYFFYNHDHMVLYDTKDTLHQRISMAKKVGIAHFIALYQEYM